MNGRIDAHQHFWRYSAAQYGWIEPGSNLARDHLPAALKSELEASGIAGCIAVQARETEVDTRWLLDIAAVNPWVEGVVGWVDLTAPDVADRVAELARSPRLLGFRHVVQAETDPRYLLGGAFQHGVRAVLAAGLTYDLLIRAPQLAQVPAFLDAVIIDGVGAIVIDHGAKPAIVADEWEPWAGRMAAIAREFPVFCKLSGLVTEADHATWSEDQVLRYMHHLLECFGPDRLIFGSDWPVCTLAASYAQVHGLAERFLAPLTDGEREAIMGGTARRAYARLAAPVQGEIEK